MKVILKKNIDKTGASGDIINVSEGYARNYLIPKGFAVLAEGGNLKNIEHHKRVIQDKVNKERKESEKVAEKLAAHSCTVAKKVGEDEKIFGSVTTADIEAALKKDGFSVSKKDIVIDEPIKALGIYTVHVKVATGVDANLKIWVVKE
jgi:large subunit ribosomal protein L9